MISTPSLNLLSDCKGRFYEGHGSEIIWNTWYYALLIWTAIRDAPHTGRARLFGFLKIIVVMLVYLHKWDLVHINQFVDSFNNSWKLPAIIVKDHVSIDR